MYSERMLQGETDLSPNETERPPTSDEHVNSPPKPSPRKLADTRILIIGPSGAGKSSLINMICDAGLQVASEGMGLCTTKVWSLNYPFTINERPFRLIDSPGFNTSTFSNADVLNQLVAHLAKARDKYHAKLSGVLYLHPQGDNLACEQLKHNLQALTHLFGEPWLPNFIFAVVNNNAAVESDAVHSLQDSSSPFYPLRLAGAKFRHLAFDLSHIQNILSEFDPTPPSDARFYARVRWYPSGKVTGLEFLMDEVLGSQRITSTKKTGRLTRITLEESEITRQQLQTTLDVTETELKSLRSQLEQTQLEYASLRSELQLNDNTEQSKIVQSLQDLNRAIDDFGRSVAQYMVDNFAVSFNKDDPTTLDASNFTELQRQFGHEGGHSLTLSPKGDGFPIEDFIDLAVRSFLCQTLYKVVFTPFHPNLSASPESGFMSSLYEEVRHQGSSIIAAKWRASSFMALSKGHKLDNPIIERQIESLIKDDIQPLLDNIFGQGNSVTLTESQRSQLQGIVIIGWELNHLLKGEVVTLGDFYLLYHERGVSFDRKNMVEFEPDKERGPGDVVICTIGLGLTLSYSKGAGNSASPLVVCPATVITPMIHG